MFRYKDEQGLTQRLGDAAELRAAIAAGRVGPASPFAAGDENWTVARLHPAYIEAAAGTEGARPFTFAAGPLVPDRTPFWKLRGMELLRDRRGIALVVVMSVLIAWAMNGFSISGPDADAGERRALAATFAAASAGDEAARAALNEPPASASLRPAWVALTASLDILDSINHVRAELGYDGSGPPGFMSDDYVRSPSRYPVVPEHLRMLETYHDRCAAIFSREPWLSVQTRGRQAGMHPARIQDLIDILTPQYRLSFSHQTAARVAALRIQEMHALVLRNEGAVWRNPDGRLAFRNPGAQTAYERLFEQIEADGQGVYEADQKRQAAVRAALKELGL